DNRGTFRIIGITTSQYNISGSPCLGTENTDSLDAFGSLEAFDRRFRHREEVAGVQTSLQIALGNKEILQFHHLCSLSTSAQRDIESGTGDSGTCEHGDSGSN